MILNSTSPSISLMAECQSLFTFQNIQQQKKNSLSTVFGCFLLFSSFFLFVVGIIMNTKTEHRKGRKSKEAGVQFRSGPGAKCKASRHELHG